MKIAFIIAVALMAMSCAGPKKKPAGWYEVCVEHKEVGESPLNSPCLKKAMIPISHFEEVKWNLILVTQD